MITGVLSGYSSLLRCVALSRDNSYVVSGGDDSTIIAHSTKTGIVEYRADNVFANEVRVFAVFWMAHLWLVAFVMIMNS